MENLTWKSCCRKRNCPEYAFDGEFIHIRDDFGGQIKLTPDQFSDIESELVYELDPGCCCSDSCS